MADTPQNPNCDPNFVGPGGATGMVWDDPGPPDVDAQNLLCQHGPCRHFWQTRSLFAAANNNYDALPGGVEVHKITKRFCTRHPGDPDPDITDDRIYECSEWDPVDLVQIRGREQRRAAAMKAAGLPYTSYEHRFTMPTEDTDNE